MARVLVVDDDNQFRRLVVTILRSKGHEVTDGEDGLQGLERFQEQEFDLVVSDIEMPNMNGLSLLAAVMKERRDIPVIMLTAVAEIKTALGALEVGAFDYVIKPFQIPELLDAVKRALSWDATQASGTPSSSSMAEFYGLDGVVAVSPSMRAACEMVRRVAPAHAAHLITGEVGTGRKLLARALHSLSASPEEPFVIVRCRRADPAGLETELFGFGAGARGDGSSGGYGALIAAGGGTVLLEDVEGLPLEIQDRLLRCVKEREMAGPGGTTVPVSARILATTSADLQGAVEAGQMRGDLYNRVTLFPVITQPLRERKEDIIPLVWHFIRHAMDGGENLPTLPRDSQGALEHYPWPGNVGELKSAIIEAVKGGCGGRIRTVDLPASILRTLDGLELEPVTAEPEDERGRAFRARLADKGIPSGTRPPVVADHPITPPPAPPIVAAPAAPAAAEAPRPVEHTSPPPPPSPPPAVAAAPGVPPAAQAARPVEHVAPPAAPEPEPAPRLRVAPPLPPPPPVSTALPLKRRRRSLWARLREALRVIVGSDEGE